MYLKGKIISVPLSNIGKIKTKHSAGNNIVIGALIGGGSLAVIGLLSGDDNSGILSLSANEKVSLGLVGGGFFGAIIGAITAIFKKSKLYIIYGSKMKLKDFKEKISGFKLKHNISKAAEIE
ncbi:hypothetical protein [Winogradskyella thalassocola]|uniref:Uncharacterized protein n=1 Tax=Winogradskyella thalassocola TaxID=262004 RepID=A0A1G8I7J4_9FLAO|nr:hypothetical protein [Winogradskyella thalassocola]SDI14792.1 hypothetical protein SAMN04489796_107157 [Winogradskyella thalassocola]